MHWQYGADVKMVLSVHMLGGEEHLNMSVVENPKNADGKGN